MDYFYCFVLVFLSLFVLFFAKIVFSRFDNVTLKFVEFLIYYKVFFYMLLPAVLRGWSGFDLDYAISVKGEELVAVYMMEAFSYIIWISVYVSILLGVVNNKTNFYWINIAEKFTVIILILYVYLSLNDFFEIFGVAFPLGAIIPALNLFDPLVMALGPIVSCFGLVYYKWGSANKTIFYLALLAYIIFMIMSFVSGVRGLIVHSMFFLLFMLFLFRKRKLVINIFFLLFLFAIFQSYYMSIRHLGTEDKVGMLSSGDIGKQQKTLIEELEFRYGEQSRLSVAFLRRGLESKFVGTKPLESSLYAPLPREFFPNKPIPGSIGDDKYSMGMYLINKDLRGEWWNMTEFFPSAHSYWEFGIAGVIFVSIISALYIAFLTFFLLRLKLLSIPFLLLFFKPWGYNEMKIWLYEIPLQIFQYVVPALLLLFLLVFLNALVLSFFRKVKL